MTSRAHPRRVPPDHRVAPAPSVISGPLPDGVPPLDTAWTLEGCGQSARYPDAGRAESAHRGTDDQLRFEPDLELAVDGAGVVVENGPENLAFKRELFGRIEKVVGPETLLLTSTSGTRSPTSPGPDRRGAVLVGHPFNPPHLVPLVELCPGERTDPARWPRRWILQGAGQAADGAA